MYTNASLPAKLFKKLFKSSFRLGCCRVDHTRVGKRRKCPGILVRPYPDQNIPSARLGRCAVQAGSQRADVKLSSDAVQAAERIALAISLADP